MHDAFPPGMQGSVLGKLQVESDASIVRAVFEGLAAVRELAPCCQLVLEHLLASGATWAAIWEVEGDEVRLVASGGAMPTVEGCRPPWTDLAGLALTLALERGGEAIGCLAIGPPKSQGEWSEAQVAAWHTLGQCFALAWACLRVECDLQRTRRLLGRRELDLGALFGVSQELNSSLSSETIGQTLLLSAMGHCASRIGSVFIFCDGHPAVVAEQGLTPEHRESSALAAALQGAILPADAIESRPWGLFVPIRHGEDLSGLLALSPKLTGRPFSREEVNFLGAMAEQAGVALANARYCEELQDTLERERRIYNEKEKMRSYLSSAAMAHVEAGDGEAGEAKTVWATVLFGDVRGFTALAEKYPAQGVVRLLNTYMGRMAEVIVQHGGVVDKFMGDGIMAFFQPVYEEDNEAFRAVSCAIAMRQEVARMNQEGVFGDGMELHVGIGLNSGEAVAGNIGSKDRMDFTLIGDTVNLSARLESAARPGQILLSTSTVERVGGLVRTEYLDTLVLKGKAVPLDVFQVP